MTEKKKKPNPNHTTFGREEVARQYFPSQNHKAAYQCSCRIQQDFFFLMMMVVDVLINEVVVHGASSSRVTLLCQLACAHH